MTTKVKTDRYQEWTIIMACAVMQFVADGLMKSFGLFYVKILEEFKETVSLTTLISGFFNGVYCLAALSVLVCFIKFVQPRTIIIIGSFLTALGYILSCLAPNIYFLFFTISLLAGVGIAGALPPGLVVLGTYFPKKRATATGIVLSGGCLGGLLCPLLYQYFLDNYGLRGAFLLTGGVLLHNLPMAGLLRSLSTDKRNDYIEKELKLNGNIQQAESRSAKNEECHAPLINYEIKNGNENQTLNTMSHQDFCTCHMDVRIEQSVHSKTRSEICIHSRSKLESRSLSLPNLFKYPSNNSIVAFSLTQHYKEYNDNPIPVLKSWKQHPIFRLLTNPTFLLFCFAISIANTVTSTFASYLPMYATENNIDNNKIVILVSLTGACDFVGRLLVGPIADRRIIKTPYIIAFSQIICGIVYNCNQLMTDFTGLICFTVFIGLLSTVYLPLMHSMTAETFGQDMYPSAVAILIFSQLPIYILGPLVFGLLRDSTGNFIASFHVIGAVGILSALLLIFVPITEKCYKTPQGQTS